MKYLAGGETTFDACEVEQMSLHDSRCASSRVLSRQLYFNFLERC